MSQNIATEALSQRGRSQFFLDLIDLYKNTQDDLRGLGNAPDDKYMLYLSKSNFKVKLKSIIMKHTGLQVKNIFIDKSKEPSLYVYFGMTERLIRKTHSQNLPLVKIFDRMDNVYNDREGRFENKNHIPEELSLVFGISTAMFRLRRRSGDYYFKPEELSALTLHEVGHYDYYVRSYGKINSLILDASDIVDYVRKNTNIKDIKEILSRLKKSKMVPQSWSKLLDVTSDYFENSVDHHPEELNDALANVKLLFAASVANIQLKEASYNIFSNKKIIGDVLHTTEASRLEEERSADDYSARHGTYEFLVSGIRKIHEVSEKDSYIYYDQFLWTKVSSVLSLMNKFKSYFDISAESTIFGYDPLIRRLELIVQTAKHSFSNLNLPDEIKEDIRKQIESSEKEIKEIKNSSYMKTRLRINSMIEMVGKTGKIITNPFVGRMDRDYSNLQNASRDISRHSLYYLADK